MSATGAVVRSGLARHRAQTVVLAVTAFVSVAASVLGVGLIVASDAPFDRAFDRQHGAHWQIQVDAHAASAAQLAATSAVDGVQATAGPFPVAVLPLTWTLGRADSAPSEPGAVAPADDSVDLGMTTIVGRASPEEGVDALALREGRWAERPGEIVISRGWDAPVTVGAQLVVGAQDGTSTRSGATLTVVGIAQSVTHSAQAWVAPAAIPSLTGTQRPTAYQELYRLTGTADEARLAQIRQRIETMLPAGSVTAAQSSLTVRQQLTANSAAFVPFVLAFGVIALVISVLVIGLVTSGTVATATRRIGILKALGFTPWRLAGALVVPALVPTAIGVVLGAGTATAVAEPILAEIEDAYGAGGLTIPLGISAMISAAALLLVTVAVLVPTLAIARRPTVALLRFGGRAARTHRGRWAQRVAGRWPIPRSIALGLGSPFRRPGRTAAVAASVLSAAACVTLAAGLAVSLGQVQHSRSPLAGASVEVGPRFDPDAAGPPSSFPALADPAAVARTLAEHAQTGAVFGTAEEDVAVTGAAGSPSAVAITGDSSFTHHEMVAGRWLDQADQSDALVAVVPTNLVRQTGLGVGDRLDVTGPAGSAKVTIVGEVFDLTHDGRRIYTTPAVFGAVGLPSEPQHFFVALAPGADVDSYLDRAGTALAPLGAEAFTARDGSSSVVVAMNSVIGMLAAMVLLVAVIGVINAVRVETRDRARDIGVLKSIGMAPRQVVLMVLTSAVEIGLLAGMLAVPLGIALHHAVAPAMGAAAGAVLPPAMLAVYAPPLTLALLTAGAVVAALGALGPAVRTARGSSVAALRAE